MAPRLTPPMHALMAASIDLAKRAGMPLDRIAQALGISPQEAHLMHAAYVTQLAGSADADRRLRTGIAGYTQG